MIQGDLCNRGNVDDIKCTLKLGTFTPLELYYELLYEQSHKNRSIIIRLLEFHIRKTETTINDFLNTHNPRS
jgi:hypothetical protein